MQALNQRVPSILPASLALAGLAVAFGPLLPQASAQLVAYDGFNAGPALDLAGSSGGSGWSGAWANQGTDLTLIDATGLQFPGLDTAPGSALTPVAGGVYPSSDYRRSFQLPVGTSSYYVSFLMRDDAGYGIWGGLSFGQYPYEMTVGSPLGWYTYGLMTSQGLGDTASKPLVTGETTLVVVKISKQPSGVGLNYRLYLDPVIGSAEPSFPAVSYGVPVVTALPTALSIDNGTGFTTDEIRVGLTWSSVLPAEPIHWMDLGFGKPGSTGVPTLKGVGTLAPNVPMAVVLNGALPNANAWLALGTDVLNLPFLGGILVPSPMFVLPQVTDNNGSARVQTVWPASYPAGVAISFQYWIQDSGATFGFSASNGLQAVTQ
jgi:hypothetical protein